MNIRSFICRIAVATLAVTGFISTATAQDTGLQSYDVELIIFRVNRPNATPENWSVNNANAKSASVTDDDQPATPTAPAVEPASPVDAAFPALSTAQFRMNGIEDSLRKGKNYQPLAHIGWTQPGFPLNASPKFSLQNYLPGFLPEGIALSGEVSLSRGARLLHLNLNVTYQAPDGQKYTLRETRRMRSTEKHYLDHPYFGIIALITPRG